MEKDRIKEMPKLVFRFLIISILFFLLTSLESGILFETAFHGWSGFGNAGLTSAEYTTIGKVCISVLMFMIPAVVIVIFLIRFMRCLQKKINRKPLLFDCICALFGIGIGIVSVALLNNPIAMSGEQMLAYLIEHFQWMTYGPADWMM